MQTSEKTPLSPIFGANFMSDTVTVFATSKRAPGVSEADLIAASDQFQNEFVSKQAGILRRELTRKESGEYVEIIQFRSTQDLEDVLEKEKSSEACHAFLAKLVMDDDNGTGLEVCASLVTYR